MSVNRTTSDDTQSGTRARVHPSARRAVELGRRVSELPRLITPGKVSQQGRFWRVPRLDRTLDVHVYVASLNTALATELCVRSLRAYAGCSYRLTVGDGGSTDDSLEMLEEFRDRGWLELEVDPSRPRHHQWLERWLARSDGDLLVFCDSDMEFVRPDALRPLVSVAASSGAALTVAEHCLEAGGGREPVTGKPVRMAERFSAWLFAVDPRAVSGFAPSFGFTWCEDPTIPEGNRGFDTGALFLGEINRLDLGYAVMPHLYRRRYRHFTGMTWRPILDVEDDARTAKLHREIQASLGRLRWLDAERLRTQVSLST